MPDQIVEIMEQIKERKRHRKLVYVGEDWIRRLIQMPDDVHIERIDYDMMRQTFVLVCTSPEWTVVEDYCEPPALLGTFEAVKIKAKTLHEGAETEAIVMKLELDWRSDV